MKFILSNKPRGLDSDFHRNAEESCLPSRLRSFIKKCFAFSASFSLTCCVLFIPFGNAAKVAWKNIVPQTKNELVLIEPSVKSMIEPNSIGAKAWTGSKLIEMKNGSVDDTTISAIDYVKQNGTLGSLVIYGHGDTNTLRLGKDDTTPTFKILDAFVTAQKTLGKPIAKQIVLYGCNTFRNLSPTNVARYRELAKMLGTDIVGMKELIKPMGPFISAEHLRIKPTGEIIKETEFLGHSLVSLLFNAFNNMAKPSTNWEKHYEGRTFEEGQRLHAKAHKIAYEAEIKKRDTKLAQLLDRAVNQAPTSKPNTPKI